MMRTGFVGLVDPIIYLPGVAVSFRLASKISYDIP